MKHFEELWTECENIKDSSTLEESLKDLEMKFALFKAVLVKKDDISNDEYETAISKIFGEILFSLTQISMFENVNVYKSLFSVLKLKQIENANNIVNQIK